MNHKVNSDHPAWTWCGWLVVDPGVHVVEKWHLVTCYACKAFEPYTMQDKLREEYANDER